MNQSDEGKPTEPAQLGDEQFVKQKYPDAEMYIDFGGGFVVGSPVKKLTIGCGKYTRHEAWADAASRLRATVPGEQRGETCGDCGQKRKWSGMNWFHVASGSELCDRTLDETKSQEAQQREDMATKEFPPCPFIGKFNGYCLECSFIHRTEPISEARPARPEKIERWDLQEDKLGKFMKIVPSGEFVRWHQYAALEAQKESAEDAWKRGWALGVQQSADYFGVVLTDLLKTPYTPPISPDKEGQ